MGRLIRLVLRGVADMRLHPWAQLMTIMAVSMVCILAGFFLLVVHNVNLELARNKGQVQFQVYWEPSSPMDTVEAQWAELEKMEGLREITTFTPDQALDDLSASLGAATSFRELRGDSPLPPTAQMYFAMDPAAVQQGWATDLLRRLRSLPGVEKVHYNPMNSELADSWLAVSQRVVWPAISILGLIVAMVVGNTVKLGLLTRRDEVEILSLVGARDWYVRVPLLSSGAAIGLAGSLFALGTLKGLQSWLSDILNFPPLLIRLQFLPPEQAAILVGVVMAVAVLSSWVAVRS